MKIGAIYRPLMVAAIVAMTVTLSACSGPPDDVIQEAIVNDHDALKSHVYELTKFDVTNSYDQVVGDETATVIEYTAEAKLANRNVNMGFGITLKDEDTIQGTVMLVKRGNSWYAL